MTTLNNGVEQKSHHDVISVQGQGQVLINNTGLISLNEATHKLNDSNVTSSSGLVPNPAINLNAVNKTTLPAVRNVNGIGLHNFENSKQIVNVNASDRVSTIANNSALSEKVEKPLSRENSFSTSKIPDRNIGNHFNPATTLSVQIFNDNHLIYDSRSAQNSVKLAKSVKPAGNTVQESLNNRKISDIRPADVNSSDLSRASKVCPKSLMNLAAGLQSIFNSASAHDLHSGESGTRADQLKNGLYSSHMMSGSNTDALKRRATFGCIPQSFCASVPGAVPTDSSATLPRVSSMAATGGGQTFNSQSVDFTLGSGSRFSSEDKLATVTEQADTESTCDVSNNAAVNSELSSSQTSLKPTYSDVLQAGLASPHRNQSNLRDSYEAKGEDYQVSELVQAGVGGKVDELLGSEVVSVAECSSLQSDGATINRDRIVMEASDGNTLQESSRINNHLSHNDDDVCRQYTTRLSFKDEGHDHVTDHRSGSTSDLETDHHSVERIRSRLSYGGSDCETWLEPLDVKLNPVQENVKLIVQRSAVRLKISDEDVNMYITPPLSDELKTEICTLTQSNENFINLKDDSDINNVDGCVDSINKTSIKSIEIGSAREPGSAGDPLLREKLMSTTNKVSDVIESDLADKLSNDCLLEAAAAAAAAAATTAVSESSVNSDMINKHEAVNNNDTLKPNNPTVNEASDNNSVTMPEEVQPNTTLDVTDQTALKTIVADNTATKTNKKSRFLVEKVSEKISVVNTECVNNNLHSGVNSANTAVGNITCDKSDISNVANNGIENKTSDSRVPEISVNLSAETHLKECRNHTGVQTVPTSPAKKRNPRIEQLSKDEGFLQVKGNASDNLTPRRHSLTNDRTKAVTSNMSRLFGSHDSALNGLLSNKSGSKIKTTGTAFMDRLSRVFSKNTDERKLNNQQITSANDLAVSRGQNISRNINLNLNLDGNLSDGTSLSQFGSDYHKNDSLDVAQVHILSPAALAGAAAAAAAGSASATVTAGSTRARVQQNQIRRNSTPLFAAGLLHQHPQPLGFDQLKEKLEQLTGVVGGGRVIHAVGHDGKVEGRPEVEDSERCSARENGARVAHVDKSKAVKCDSPEKIPQTAGPTAASEANHKKKRSKNIKQPSIDETILEVNLADHVTSEDAQHSADVSSNENSCTTRRAEFQKQLLEVLKKNQLGLEEKLRTESESESKEPQAGSGNGNKCSDDMNKSILKVGVAESMSKTESNAAEMCDIQVTNDFCMIKNIKQEAVLSSNSSSESLLMAGQHKHVLESGSDSDRMLAGFEGQHTTHTDFVLNGHHDVQLQQQLQQLSQQMPQQLEGQESADSCKDTLPSIKIGHESNSVNISSSKGGPIFNPGTLSGMDIISHLATHQLPSALEVDANTKPSSNETSSVEPCNSEGGASVGPCSSVGGTSLKPCSSAGVAGVKPCSSEDGKCSAVKQFFIRNRMEREKILKRHERERVMLNKLIERLNYCEDEMRDDLLTQIMNLSTSGLSADQLIEETVDTGRTDVSEVVGLDQSGVVVGQYAEDGSVHRGSAVFFQYSVEADVDRPQTSENFKPADQPKPSVELDNSLGAGGTGNEPLGVDISNYGQIDVSSMNFQHQQLMERVQLAMQQLCCVQDVSYGVNGVQLLSTETSKAPDPNSLDCQSKIISFPPVFDNNVQPRSRLPSFSLNNNNAAISGLTLRDEIFYNLPTNNIGYENQNVTNSIQDVGLYCQTQENLISEASVGCSTVLNSSHVLTLSTDTDSNSIRENVSHVQYSHTSNSSFTNGAPHFVTSLHNLQPAFSIDQIYSSSAVNGIPSNSSFNNISFYENVPQISNMSLRSRSNSLSLNMTLNSKLQQNGRNLVPGISQQIDVSDNIESNLKQNVQRLSPYLLPVNSHREGGEAHSRPGSGRGAPLGGAVTYPDILLTTSLLNELLRNAALTNVQNRCSPCVPTEPLNHSSYGVCNTSSSDVIPQVSMSNNNNNTSAVSTCNSMIHSTIPHNVGPSDSLTCVSSFNNSRTTVSPVVFSNTSLSQKLTEENSSQNFLPASTLEALQDILYRTSHFNTVSNISHLCNGGLQDASTLPYNPNLVLNPGGLVTTRSLQHAQSSPVLSTFLDRATSPVCTEISGLTQQNMTDPQFRSLATQGLDVGQALGSQAGKGDYTSGDGFIDASSQSLNANLPSSSAFRKIPSRSSLSAVPTTIYAGSVAFPRQYTLPNLSSIPTSIPGVPGNLAGFGLDPANFTPSALSNLLKSINL